ncbi:Redoxin domain protein [Desulfobulbus propionicus DSM 2032]|jgi:thiol-disulfide isomerase/thioredoxin|uniref:Redoxin domain protein n=1 Tax=Desulfobulbus propionicus (strain ATCC 33891 / DSM 2032 / VKM B-1956 / 1pr3) TaxID=577650 RepID=A0A7U3YJW6_DESPD|nr:TlpA disulfide reductase family protein [Desulfobulbus propionicus]ADW16738.1 Redoxin domain protein [Desulfobulbus propionicus DSM 2032]
MMRKNAVSSLLVFLLVLAPCSLLAVQEGQRLIPFQGTDLNGNPIDLQRSIGSKPVMLIFWASWCPTCKTEVPKINKLAEQYSGRGMDFIAVNVGYNDSVERAQAFAQKNGMRYPAFFDGSGKVSEQYQLLGVPTIIIADKHGVVRFRNFVTPDIPEETFAKLMAE